MVTNVLKGPLFKPLLWAMILHLLFLLIFPRPQNYGEKDLEIGLRPVEISTLEPSEIKKFRTIGVKGGKKEFSVPINNRISSSASSSSQTKTTQRPESKDFSISKDIPNPRIQYPAQKITKELFPSMNGPGLPSSSINIGFEPPEGVSETELNSTEKIYYGFSKRTYEIYISSLVSSFNKLMREKPYLDLATIPGTHNLTGRILFNQEGRAVGTQFFLQSPNENIKQLFENTLMDIRSIPNPPKGLLNRDGSFAVHYRLQVGG